MIPGKYCSRKYFLGLDRRQHRRQSDRFLRRREPQNLGKIQAALGGKGPRGKGEMEHNNTEHHGTYILDNLWCMHFIWGGRGLQSIARRVYLIKINKKHWGPFWFEHFPW